MFIVSKVSIPEYENLSVSNTKFLTYKESYDVKFNTVWHGNGDNAYPQEQTINYKIGDTFSQFPNVDQYSYRFLGWNYSISDENNYLTVDDKVDYYQRNIYAHWLSSINITFDTNTNTPGGVLWYDDGEEHFYFKGDEYGILPNCNPYNSTYEFTGWFDSAVGGNQIYESDVITSDMVTLYAQYLSMSINFNDLFINGTGYFGDIYDENSGETVQGAYISASFDNEDLINYSNYSINTTYYPNHLEGYSNYQSGIEPKSMKILYDSENYYTSFTIEYEINGIPTPAGSNAYFYCDAQGWLSFSNSSGSLWADLYWWNENENQWEQVSYDGIDYYGLNCSNDSWGYGTITPDIGWNSNEQIWGIGKTNYDTYEYSYQPMYTSNGTQITDINGKWKLVIWPSMYSYDSESLPSDPAMYLGCFNFYVYLGS